MTYVIEPGPSRTEPLVTVLGASGLIGSAVAARLATHPVRLRLVSRTRAIPGFEKAPNTEILTTDLVDRRALEHALSGSDAVVHTLLNTGGWRAAGEAGGEQVNVGVMRDMVEFWRRHTYAPVVVFAGSASQVGQPGEESSDFREDHLPPSIYDEHKQEAERLLLTAGAEGVVRGICLRLPTVYGPGPIGTNHAQGVLASMTRRALRGEPLTLWHDGRVRRDLLHVDDAAEAFIAALNHEDTLRDRSWLIGTGRGEPLGDVLRTLTRLVADRTGRPAVPVRTKEPPLSAVAADTRDVVVDSSAFRAATGWRPRVPLRRGLTHMVSALVQQSRSSFR